MRELGALQRLRGRIRRRQGGERGGAARLDAAAVGGDLRGDAAGVGHDAGQDDDDEGGQLAAEQEDEAEGGDALEVVGVAQEELVVGARELAVLDGGEDGAVVGQVDEFLGLARQGEVREDGAGAGLVEGEVGFALEEEVFDGGLAGDLFGELERRGEGRGRGVEARVAWFRVGEGGRGGVGGV